MAKRKKVNLDPVSASARSLRTRGWLIGATAAAVVCRVCLALFTYGTNDASMWESSASLIRETGARSIYEHPVEVRDPQGSFLHYQIFNHPPFMIRVLSGLNWINDATGVPVRSSLRLLDTAADAATVMLTATILQEMLGAVPMWSMLLVAIAPSWIFVSGFHANTDPLMVFFLVLAVYLIEARRQTTWGVLSFAFATGIKIVPIVLLPALLLYFRTWSDRLRAALILMVFWSATSLPWLIASPAALARNMLGYSSLTGHWGLGLVLPTLPLIGAVSAECFNRVGRSLLLFTLLATAWRLNRGKYPISLFYQFGLSLFLFLLVTPGFGIQYLAWLTPWLAALPWRLVATHLISSGVFSAAVYTYWSGAVPWYYANSVATGTWKGTISALGLATWCTVALIVAAYWRHLRCVPEIRTEQS